MSSRERLDMDGERTASSGLTFKQRKGVFLTRCTLGVLLVLALLVIVAVGILVAYLTPCSGTKKAEESNDTVVVPPKEKLYMLLPRSVVPDHYVVELQPYIFPENFTFDGRVTVTVNCTEDTDNITLHVNNITIHEETVQLVGVGETSAPKIKEKQHDTKRQFFILKLESNLKAGERYNVSMKYLGSLNDKLNGFYRSSYNTSTGEVRWMATTQFQATDARKAFPCFDEPAFKATFDITLVRPKNMVALSNMPEAKTEPRGDDWEAVTFERTVPMSTYLLAFIVSDYKSIKDNNSKMAVWTREEALETANYALQTGSFILKYFEEFFAIGYPLPKMDMVSIPDFSAGAMENWGLITYREARLLYDPKVSSAGNKQSIAAVISHELAHQWFGNLVTPKWWDDLWLNEGFASYVEILGVDKKHPDWEMHSQFVLDDLQSVLELDSLKSSHPISVEVGDPDEISEIFDKISYSKGASVIRMMYFFLGNDTFRRGLTSYLKSKQYSNAVQDDLWKSLTEAQTGKDKIDVKTVMDSWTLQTGYPLVTLTRNYSSGKGNVTQSRFLLDSAAADQESYFWEVPITYTDSQNPDWTPTTKLWLHKNNGTLDGLPSSDHWVIMNLQEVSYYRVNYDEKNWQLILQQLEDDHQKIHVINRAQILDDLMDMARAGVVSYDLALNATKYLFKEKEYVPWDAALNNMAYLSKMVSRSTIYGKWKKYIVRQLEPLYQELKWDEDIEKETILRQYLRINVLNWMCKYDYPECIEGATSRFQLWKNDTRNISIIPPNLKSIIYCTAIRHGGQEAWDFMWKQYKAAKLASEKDKLLRSLSCAREPWLLTRFLEWSITPDSGIRTQDGSYVFRSVAGNLYGRDIAFNYFRDKWDRIFNLYGKMSFTMGSLVSSISSSLNTQFELDQLKDFYEQHKNELGTAQRALTQAMESTKANVDWLQKNFKSIKNWLDVVVPS